jgi:P-type E1-E2 ATPase
MKKWEDIEPGNVVRFKKDQEAPADIMILYSSNKSGVVYVDTMNLDGETNLKEKNSLLEELDEKRMNLITGETRCD